MIVTQLILGYLVSFMSAKRIINFLSVLYFRSIKISRKTQSVPPARKDTWLSVPFYRNSLIKPRVKLDEKSIENGLEGQKFLVVCLSWGGCHHPNRSILINIDQEFYYPKSQTLIQNNYYAES